MDLFPDKMKISLLWVNACLDLKGASLSCISETSSSIPLEDSWTDADSSLN